MGFLHRYRNNEPVHRHTGPEGGVPPYHPPSRRLTRAEMPHNSGKRIDALHEALTEMHDRGVIDLFSVMANHLGSLDSSDIEDPELRDLHEMAHGWAGGERNT